MNETNRTIFSGMQILSGSQWLANHAVVVEQDKIKAIIGAEMIPHHLPAKRREFPADHYLVPGFIDLHIHGAHGYDVMDGTPEAFHEMSRALAEEGVTSFLATTMTAPNEKMESVLAAIPVAMEEVSGAAILGVHLEGTFIAQSKKGAQPSEWILAPDVPLMRRWQKLAKNTIKIVTLAPELPEILPFVKALHEMDIIASIGHTNATYDETCAAISAGCTQATHLFNSMTDLRQRHPGAVGALLLADNVNAEVIADGVHLHAAIIQIILRMKGKDRLLLVTDAMRAKCMGDGIYELGGQQVEVKGKKAMLADGTLAGSVLRMPEAIKNMAGSSQCALAEAILMATKNPARALRIDPTKGAIAVGLDADLVVLDSNINVALTVRAGKDIFLRTNHNNHASS